MLFKPMPKETLNSRVAVLETRVEAISVKLDEVRADIKEVHVCLHKTRELILDQIENLRTQENTQHDKFNTRLSQLENWRWYTIGIVSAIGVVANLLFNL
jgi:DNA-binding transcriptional regulator YiaG